MMCSRCATLRFFQESMAMVFMFRSLKREMSMAVTFLSHIESVRELKKYGTTVIFENDGIDTKTMNHELIL